MGNLRWLSINSTQHDGKTPAEAYDITIEGPVILFRFIFKYPFGFAEILRRMPAIR